MSKTTGIYVEVETRDLLKAQAKEAGMNVVQNLCTKLEHRDLF